MEQKIPQMCFQGNMAENWKKWRQRFEIYTIAAEISAKDEKIQCAQLLHLMGEEAINIFNTFIFAEEDYDKIEPLKKKFQEYFTPKKNLTYERYKFFTYRQTTETIEQFATELKVKATQCEFGNLKEELIKTMLITGIKDDPTREKLLQKEELTLEKAIECCVLTEHSRKQLQEMKSVHPRTTQVNERREYEAENVQVNRVRAHQTKPSGDQGHRNKFQARSSSEKKEEKVINNCSRCGKSHRINNCPAYEKTCSKCNKPNHFAKQCRNNFKVKNNLRRVNDIEIGANHFSIDNIDYAANNCCTMFIKTSDNCGNERNLKYKIDSGACANLISL